nr:structural protein [Tolivirales sp.]
MVRKTGETAKKTVTQYSQRKPRLNLRGTLNSNTVLLTGNEYNHAIKTPVTATDGVVSVFLAPGNAWNRTNAPVQKVGALFQKGIYLPGTKLTYIPSVGLNTPGNIIIGFLDSPVMIENYFSKTTDADRIAFLYDLGNFKTGPVWQQMEYPLTQPPRRKVFITDNSISAAMIDYDLSMQGMWIVAVAGTNAGGSGGTTVGQLVIHCRCKFEEVKSHTS